MEKIILIKYGELTTKKDNRKQFINLLYNNIFEKLKKYNVKIIKEYSRMFIEFDDKDFDEVVFVLKNTFGILEFNLAYKVHTNSDDIKDSTLKLLKNENFETFKVVTKRSDKSFSYDSMQFNDIMGGLILKNINCKVDVHNPDIYVFIEIRKDYTYIYFNKYKGLGGYPVGIQGKGLLMLSGGIDSPVAGYLALKRGIKINCIYFEAIPHTSIEARNKVIDLARELLKYTSDIKLFIVPITKLQESIYKNIDPTYMITILRRMMYRISEKVANKFKHLVLINGESIGQVASQTLTSMSVINEVVKMPVIRPVACMDKIEIIDIAKKINTYETSILPYEDCCTIFVPRHPVINPRLDKAKEYETSINYEEMINEAVENIEVVKIEEKEEVSNIF